MGSWYDYGNRDASAGYPKERLAKHFEACTEYGVTPNKEQYEAGFKEGLKTFCTPDNGYEWGLKGGQYYNSCPAILSSAFTKRYNAGKEVYTLRAEQQRLESEIDSLSQQMVSGKTQNERTNAMFQLREKERKKSEIEKKLLLIEVKEEIKKQ